MSTVKKIREIGKTVEFLLQREPALRDSDNALVATIWEREFVGSKQLTAFDFMMAYSQGLITTADNITRARRLIQEENPLLRGELWAKRQKKSDDFGKEI
jgi:hypothetical protein